MWDALLAKFPKGSFCASQSRHVVSRLPYIHCYRFFAGDYSGGETPVPIPNTAVKPASAHGTARATGWESRSLPAQSFRPLRQPIPRRGLFLLTPTLTITPANHTPQIAEEGASCYTHNLGHWPKTHPTPPTVPASLSLYSRFLLVGAGY